MKVIQNGYKFRIYDNDIQTHNQLPAQSFSFDDWWERQE